MRIEVYQAEIDRLNEMLADALAQLQRAEVALEESGHCHKAAGKIARAYFNAKQPQSDYPRPDEDGAL